MKKLTGSKATFKIGDDMIDALRYGINPDPRRIIKEAKDAVVNIMRCHAKAGYVKVMVKIPGSDKDEFCGWADPDVFMGGGPISVLGRFDPVDITIPDILGAPVLSVK